MPRHRRRHDGGGLQAAVLSSAPLELRYSFPLAEGELVMADGHCASMEAAIALFAAIDPHAVQLRVFSGDEAAFYMRHGEKWEAVSPRRARRQSL